MFLLPFVWAYLRWAYYFRGDPAPLAYQASDWIGLVLVLPVYPVYATAHKVFG